MHLVHVVISGPIFRFQTRYFQLPWMGGCLKLAS